MGNKVEYKRDIHEVSDATTPWDIELSPVRQGYKLTIQHLSFEDEDSGCTEVKIGYKNQFGVYHWWEEESSPEAGKLYWMENEKRLTEGMILVVRFVGTTNEDDLYVYVDGFEELRRRP